MTVSLSDIMGLLDKKSAPILIVDEDKVASTALAAILKEANFCILIASNPDEAIEILRKNAISILIAHHKTAGTSGIHFLSKIRDLFPSIERVLITSEILPDHVVFPIQPSKIFQHPINKNAFLDAMHDRFNYFRLKEEHSMLSNKSFKDALALKSAKNLISRELGLGKQIHRAFLIDPTPKDLPGVSLFVSSHSSSELDGDFISFFRSSSHLLDFAIGDVMGKGLSSALVGTAIKGEITRFAEPEERSLVFNHRHFWHENLPSIKEIIQQVHSSYVNRLLELEYFVSLFYGRLDLDKRVLTFIDCGFTKPLFFRKSSNKAIFIKATNFPLGTVVRHEYFPFEVNFETGDFFVFYSDGVIESVSSEGELFGEKRLSDIIERYHDLTPHELAEKVKQSLIAFTGKETLEDDFTLIIIRMDQLCPVSPSNSGVAKFNSVLNHLEAVRKLTKELCCRSPGNVERLSAELELAVDEIFTNIVMHGYENKPGSPICISRVYLPDQIVIEITDQGHPFDPFEVSPLNLFGDQDHGYGWHLIRQIADQVIYTPKSNQSGWNRLSLFKKYYTKSAKVMEFTPVEKNGILILQLESETLDAKQVPEFKEDVIQLLDKKGLDRVIFDLHKLQFIDSSGLGAFLSLFRHLNMKGGQMSLAAMSKPVKSIFELVSMQKIFDCHDTIDQAIAANGK